MTMIPIHAGRAVALGRHASVASLVATALAIAPAVVPASAQPPREPPAAGDADGTEPVDFSPRERQHAALHVRYAEARVRLAQADLEKARELNRQVPNAVSAIELAALEDRIALLEGLARDARERPHGNGLAVQRASSRDAARRALAAIETARRVKRSSGSDGSRITDIDLSRLELRAEVARLRAELWDDPVMVPSLIDEMQVQIEQLSEQVHDLTHQLELLRAGGVIAR